MKTYLIRNLDCDWDKDELEALSALHRVANNNSKLESHVSLLARSIKEDSEKKEKRKYNVRVRTDLTTRFERIHAREGRLK